jgi:glycosyl hydrolase family 17
MSTSGQPVGTHPFFARRASAQPYQQVRAKLGHSVRITMAEVYDVWKDHLDLAEDLDFVTVHIYPFWQQVSLDSAIPSLAANYNDLKNRIKARFPSKNISVVIGETGWPSDGPPQGAAKPSAVNQARYFKDFIDWENKQQEKIDYFYFDAFDEEWKVNEAGVGTHWGLYQLNGVVKPELSSMIPAAAPETLKQRSYRNVYSRGLSSGLDIGLDTSGQQGAWLTNQGDSLLLTYPAQQAWGTAFITVGKPAPLGNRPSRDFSMYHSLEVEMRAKIAGQCVRLGIKDRTQPDDGNEITVRQCLTTQWTTSKLPLSIFANVDLTHLYTLFEVIFEGSASQTVELRSVRYSPDPAVLPPTSPTLTTFGADTDYTSTLSDRLVDDITYSP